MSYTRDQLRTAQMVDIVKFEIDRSSELAELNRLLIIDEGHSNSMSASELEQRMKHWLSSGYESYGIEHEGRIICYSLWRDDGDFYYMRQLYTEATFRCRGIARRLVVGLVESLYSDKPVRLDVLVENSDARRFYEHIGFQIYCHTMIKQN